MALKDICVLRLRTCDYYFTWQNSEAVITLKTLRCGDYSRLSRWALKVITSVLIRGGKETFDYRREAGNVMMVTESGAMHPKLRNAGSTRELEEARNGFSSEASRQI